MDLWVAEVKWEVELERTNKFSLQPHFNNRANESVLAKQYWEHVPTRRQMRSGYQVAIFVEEHRHIVQNFGAIAGTVQDSAGENSIFLVPVGRLRSWYVVASTELVLDSTHQMQRETQKQRAQDQRWHFQLHFSAALDFVKSLDKLLERAVAFPKSLFGANVFKRIFSELFDSMLTIRLVCIFIVWELHLEHLPYSNKLDLWNIESEFFGFKMILMMSKSWSLEDCWSAVNWRLNGEDRSFRTSFLKPKWICYFELESNPSWPQSFVFWTKLRRYPFRCQRFVNSSHIVHTVWITLNHLSFSRRSENEFI